MIQVVHPGSGTTPLAAALHFLFFGLVKGSDPDSECFEEVGSEIKIIPDAQDCLASRVPELDAGVEGPGGQVLAVRVEFNTADGRLVTCRQ